MIISKMTAAVIIAAVILCKKINLIESNWDLVWFNKVNYSIGHSD